MSGPDLSVNGVTDYDEAYVEAMSQTATSALIQRLSSVNVSQQLERVGWNSIAATEHPAPLVESIVLQIGLSQKSTFDGS